MGRPRRPKRPGSIAMAVHRGSVARFRESLNPPQLAPLCEIASNCDPSQGRSISLITRVNPFPGWGHAWTRKMTPSIPIFGNEINALGNFREGVNIAIECTIKRTCRPLIYSIPGAFDIVRPEVESRICFQNFDLTVQPAEKSQRIGDVIFRQIRCEAPRTRQHIK